MPRLAASLWINTDPLRVFETCQAPAGPLLPKGGPRLVVLGQPGAVGSRYRWEFRRWGLFGRLDSAVTEAEPGRRLLFRGQSGWQMEAELSLTPEDGGTRLVFRMQYRFPFPFRWLVPGGLIRLGAWHALHKIRAEAEEPLPAGRLSTT